MAADYILWLTLPQGAQPSKPPVFGSARLANGSSGTKGRVTVIHGDKAIQETLRLERRAAFAKGHRLYRADLELSLDRKKQPNAKPSAANVKKFERLDLAAMTGDLRQALKESLQTAVPWLDTVAELIEYVNNEPEILNVFWDTDVLKHVKVMTLPGPDGDPSQRRAVLKSATVIKDITMPEWPDEWPMPILQV